MMIRVIFATLAAAILALSAAPSMAQQSAPTTTQQKKSMTVQGNATCSPSPNITQSFPIPTIIQFDTGSSKIKPADQQKIAKLATEAKAKYITQICVTGHADKQGDAKKNEALSTARANAVAAELKKNGIAPGTLVVSGKGEPLGSTLSSVDLKSQADRAVEIKIAR
jgi:outer membrane protein OmpA-like peptidoglycan-associated protein